MNDWYALTNDLDTQIPPLDEVSKARIKKRVRSALPRRKKHRALAAVIAAVLALSACGYAVATGRFSDWFFNKSADPNAPEASEDLLSSMGTAIGQSQTVNGTTATLHGAIWDGETLMLSLTLEGENVPTDYWTNVKTEDSWLWFSDASTAATIREHDPDISEANLRNYLDTAHAFAGRAKVTYLYNRQAESYGLQVQNTITAQSSHVELTLHLENLKFQNVTLTGPFEFTFTVEKKSVELVYEGSVTMEPVEGVPIRVTRVVISPLRAEVSFEGLAPMKQDENGRRAFDELSLNDFLADDKTDFGANANLRHGVFENDGTWKGSVSRGPFSRVMDPSTVKALQINDTWLELKDFTLVKPTEAKKSSSGFSAAAVLMIPFMPLNCRILAVPQDFPELHGVGVALGGEHQHLAETVQAQEIPQVLVLVSLHDGGDEAHAHGAGLTGNDGGVALHGHAQHSHTTGADPVGAGDKSGNMVAQDVPGDNVGLAAGKARHNSLEVALHDAGIAVPGHSALIQAVRRTGFHDDELGRIVGKQIGVEAHHCAGKAAHASLDKHMGRTVDAHLPQLVGRLPGHGAVALHNPGGNLLITLPGSILDDDTVLRLGGLGGGHANALIVVHILDGDLGPLFLDVLKAALRAALGHMDNGLLAQLIGSPGHAPAMVAVGGGEEGGLAELPAEGLAGQIVIGHLADVPVHLLGDIPCHGKGAAQHLEGVEPEAERLILHIQAAQAQILGHTVQTGQGRDGILRKAVMEKAGLRHIAQGHDLKLLVVTGRHMIDGPLDLLFHTALTMQKFLA